MTVWAVTGAAVEKLTATGAAKAKAAIGAAASRSESVTTRLEIFRMGFLINTGQ
jgi:hypothetical protein